MKRKIVDGFTGLFVATPCYGKTVTEAYLLSAIATVAELDKHGIPFTWATVGNESLVTRARNYLVAQFMAGKCSHMLFLDADIGWDAQAVMRLLTLDHDFVVGAYRKKMDKREYTVNWTPDAATKLNQCQECGCVEILDGPAGFMFLSRSVFERMFAAFQHLKYELKIHNPMSPTYDETTFALFDCQLHDGGYWGEDYVFCQRWRSLGGQVWLDPSARLDHWGMTCFEGDVTEMLASPESDIEGWLTGAQANVLRGIVAELPGAPVIVELGSWKGRSTVVLGLAAQARGGRVYAVDNWQGSVGERHSAHREAQTGAVYDQFLRNINSRGVGDVVTPCTGDVVEVAFSFAEIAAGAEVDLLFLDADHGTDATMAAFRAWEPHLKPGGTVVFHDADWVSVGRAIQQLGLDVIQRDKMAIWTKPQG
ncbi:MAG TPA: class I SAM-dependent methyltransferase [Propionibacteriaceae bacterium]|nr:class I SAM-dependent methyltransferase [Propionibacteriaceae bacterium]